MDKKQPEPMTPFDELTIPKQLRLIKLLLPFTPATNQRTLGILIKFFELQHTIQYFQRSYFQNFSEEHTNPFDNPANMLDLLLPYLSPDEKQTADSFRQIIDMMELMQTFSSQKDGSSDNPEANPMDFIMNMFSPEQQEIFQNYQEIFNSK